MSTIKPDYYESNSFLLEKEPSLIEYAFFYGSIQIIKYLLNNHVEFTPEIWPYVIHSNNVELFSMVEGNKIHENCVKESNSNSWYDLYMKQILELNLV